MAAVAAPARTRAPAFHVALALFMCVVVVAGFFPYFRDLFTGRHVVRPGAIHVHGAVFVGWMALLVTQAALVYTRRTPLHRKLGRFGMWYGGLVFVMGCVATVVAPAAHVARGEWTVDRAAGFLILPIGDMILFGTLFAVAMIQRKRPDVHKRCIVLATVALLFAPAARFGEQWGPGGVLAVWFLPLVAAMLYDGVTRRRVHRAYLIGTAFLLAGFLRVFLMENETWLRVGRVILAALGATPPA